MPAKLLTVLPQNPARTGAVALAVLPAGRGTLARVDVQRFESCPRRPPPLPGRPLTELSPPGLDGFQAEIAEVALRANDGQGSRWPLPAPLWLTV